MSLASRGLLTLPKLMSDPDSPQQRCRREGIITKSRVVAVTVVNNMELGIRSQVKNY